MPSILRGTRILLQLIQHFRKCVLDLQSLLYFIRAEVGILSVFQKARALVITDEPDEGLGVGLPIHREAFEVFEDCTHAGSAEECDGIFGVLVKVGIKDALIHKVGLAVNWKQYPSQIMELKRCENIGLSSQSLLDVLCVLIKDRLAAGNDFRDDR